MIGLLVSTSYTNTKPIVIEKAMNHSLKPAPLSLCTAGGLSTPLSLCTAGGLNAHLSLCTAWGLSAPLSLCTAWGLSAPLSLCTAGGLSAALSLCTAGGFSVEVSQVACVMQQSQLIITCSKSTIETLKKGVKYVQS